MNNFSENKLYGIIIAGVGGQGAITLAQLFLAGAWKSGYDVMQSEVHGMSQRGGSVNAQILFSKNKLTSPIVLEGSGDMIIGMEPLETLRFLNYLKKDAHIISSTVPVKNISNYPEESILIDELNKFDNSILVDTDKHSKELNNRNAGNIILLGVASTVIPIENEIWYEVIKERFGAKGEAVIKKNIDAFEFGKKLAK